MAGSQPNTGRYLIRSKNGSPRLSLTQWLLVLLSPPSSIKYSRFPESPSYFLMFRCPKDTWLCSCWSPCISSWWCFFKSNYKLYIFYEFFQLVVQSGYPHISLELAFLCGFLLNSSASRESFVSLGSYRTYSHQFGGSLSTKKALAHTSLKSKILIFSAMLFFGTCFTKWDFPDCCLHSEAISWL